MRDLLIWAVVKFQSSSLVLSTLQDGLGLSFTWNSYESPVRTGDGKEVSFLGSLLSGGSLGLELETCSRLKNKVIDFV